MQIKIGPNRFHPANFVVIGHSRKTANEMQNNFRTLHHIAFCSSDFHIIKNNFVLFSFLSLFRFPLRVITEKEVTY